MPGGGLEAYIQGLVGHAGVGGAPSGSMEERLVPRPPARESKWAELILVLHLTILDFVFVDSSRAPPPQSESLQATPPPHQLEDIEERFHSSSPSSPSSLFSIPPDEDPHLLSQLGGVLREGTATPSESQGGRGSDGDPRKNGEGAKEEAKDSQESGKGDMPENQNDMNSEPNDSSGEEESGEDDHTLMENLSAKLEESGPTSGLTRTQERGVAVEGYNTYLSEMRKKLLTCLVEQMDTVEQVGGMRAICYLQVCTRRGVTYRYMYVTGRGWGTYQGWVCAMHGSDVTIFSFV